MSKGFAIHEKILVTVSSFYRLVFNNFAKRNWLVISVFSFEVRCIISTNCKSACFDVVKKKFEYAEMALQRIVQRSHQAFHLIITSASGNWSWELNKNIIGMGLGTSRALYL